MKSTKILCTIGPASSSATVLSKMVKAGMNAARLNFSHGTQSDHKKLIRTIRKVAKQHDVSMAIIQDLQGPRIRCGKLPDSGIKLQEGRGYIFTTDKEYRDNYNDDKIYVTYEDLHKDIKTGQEILIRDGLIKVKVVKVRGRDMFVKVIIGGLIESNKGMNFPQTYLNISSITKKDKEDLEFGISEGIDWVALSFVSSAKDVKDLRRIINRIEKKLDKKGEQAIKIIPKIEKFDAIESIDDIILVSDGIMIARGDLGIEMPAQMVPLLQKEIIEKCRAYGKPVVVATQMLESMIVNPRPTRAEVSDVANAVVDHTDAVMLSGESAGGSYPVESVKIMADTIKEMEDSKYDDLDYSEQLGSSINDLNDAFGLMAGVLSKSNNISAIFISSLSQELVGQISSFRPEVPIILGTFDKRLGRQSSLHWGVLVANLNTCKTSEHLIMQGLKYISKKRIAKKGNKILCIVGDPLAKDLDLNIVKVVIL